MRRAHIIILSQTLISAACAGPPVAPQEATRLAQRGRDVQASDRLPPAPPSTKGPAVTPTSTAPGTQPDAAALATPADYAVRNRAIERHRNAAIAAMRRNDLRWSAFHWHVLTLIAPDNATYREELDAVHREKVRRATELASAARSAINAGREDEAFRLFLQLIALSPTNAEAADALRTIEKQRMERAQALHLLRVRHLYLRDRNPTLDNVDGLERNSMNR